MGDPSRTGISRLLAAAAGVPAASPGDLLELDSAPCTSPTPAGHALAFPAGPLILPGHVYHGADPVVAIAGALGALGLRVTLRESQQIAAGQRLHCRVPPQLHATVQAPPPGPTGAAGRGTDFALALWQAAGAPRLLGRMVEVDGPAVSQLSLDQRIAFAALAPLCGAAAFVLVPHPPVVPEVRQATSEPFETYLSAKDAHFADRIAVAVPSASDHWVLGPDGTPAQESALRGAPIDRVIVAGPGGGTAETIAVLASLLRGRARHHAVRVQVQPLDPATASRLDKIGALRDLRDAAVEIIPPGQALPLPMTSDRVVVAGAAALLAARRVSGTECWLAGPHVCAAAALTGTITGPGEALTAPGGDSKVSARHASKRSEA